MSEVNDEQIALVRRHIGSATPPTDSQIYDAILDADGSAELVAQQYLEERLGDLLAAPAQFSISGEYGQNTAANITGIEAKLKELRTVTKTGSSSVGTVALTRPGARTR